jgi:rhodanese-related sulfurtransferase
MEDITCVELKQMLDNNEEVTLIDVREEWEYDEDNIGAKLIPLGEIPHRLDELESIKEQEIILHCRTGSRSGQAKMFLKSKGFMNVRNLLGGIEAFRSL